MPKKSDFEHPKRKKKKLKKNAENLKNTESKEIMERERFAF